ncbi:peptidase domain-containing ABC transporter [Sediminitomix flava]|uniref:ABC-type bacteriocin/lantibiotic exporter with double-glycine peptidase domain n=1 Tax=Sediminitomix flava TaxID=379075 RepID=A0A315Z894_SEDFL|nr:ATP-binding cassette domain-containing protein [Sediminitomix flava]PWJ41785.1 ABC-type bacteriocin/lantibiotic exporter with double-glycine peptidase domain [Sediminitomix flava]
MDTSQFTPICGRLASSISFDFNRNKLKGYYINERLYHNEVGTFVANLTEHAQKIGLTLIRQHIPKPAFNEFVRNAKYPVLSFCQYNEDTTPVIFHKDKGGQLQAYIYKNNEEIEVDYPEELLSMVQTNEQNEVQYIVPVPLNSLVSDEEGASEKKNGPVQRLISLLVSEKKTIVYIYFYAIIISIISLILPVGVQAVIEMVAGGVVFDSIALLIAIIIIATLVTGGLQIMQISLVEIIQRRLFVKAALEYTYRLPKMRLEAILGEHAPELMNRFFDILNIQKSLPKILIDLSAAILQILFGLVLLSFYHPFFIVFGTVLISVLVMLFYLTGPKGLKASLIESKYKYKVVHWLEEIARTLYSFKMAGSSNLSIDKTDYYTNNYLKYRKKLFNVLINQYSYIVIFKTVVTGGLLTMGTWLVINREINLGQFVASEIVIVLVIGAVEKLILNIDVVFQSLTAVEKIGYVTDIPLERKDGIQIHNNQKGLNIKLKALSYVYPNTGKKVLHDINLELKEKESICITGFNNSGKSTLINIISGLLDDFEGMVAFNDISIRDINLNSLRDNIARNVSENELFDGSILENVTMGRPQVKLEDVLWALKSVGLMDFVNMQKDGLQTQITSGGKSYSKSTATKLILARCIAERPGLLILNKSLTQINRSERLKLISFLTDKNNPWTLLCMSNDPLMLSVCDRILLMDDGQVIKDDTYENLINDVQFKESILSSEINNDN